MFLVNEIKKPVGAVYLNFDLYRGVPWRIDLQLCRVAGNSV